jgi:hypothetical protein
MDFHDYICKISGKISRFNPNTFIMKNKSLFLTLLMLTGLLVASCGSSRTGYRGTQRKGYGCPANASIPGPFIERSKV